MILLLIIEMPSLLVRLGSPHPKVRIEADLRLFHAGVIFHGGRRGGHLRNPADEIAAGLGKLFQTPLADLRGVDIASELVAEFDVAGRVDCNGLAAKGLENAVD
jgi:hypothetical protein